MISKQAMPIEEVSFGLPRRIGRRSKVLVVDDHSDVRHVIASALELIGCDVTAAVNGLEAYECFLDHGADFDLVITDLQMPLLDGHGLIDRIKRISPLTPVVVVTGYSSYDHPPIGGGTVRAVLYKPFPIKQLQQIARAVMLERESVCMV